MGAMISETKERILDAAEKLFAREGFHCTSLRAITREARVNLAAVNYHFGSKDALLSAVFARRLLPLNEIRRAGIEKVRLEARQRDCAPGLRDILTAFIEPTLRFREAGPGAQDFVALVGRAIAEPDETVRDVFMHLMEPLFLLLFDTLVESRPDWPRELLFWRLHFSLGAMSHTMCLAGKFRLVPQGVTSATENETLIAMLLDFITAGMEGA
jgi:AcrR family transcriptional regulator